MFLENQTSVHTRGELIDSYITTRKCNSDIRFILQFALPFVGKRMTMYEITKAQILSVIDLAIKLYIHNDYIYQNCISSKNINKKDLLESRQNKD